MTQTQADRERPEAFEMWVWRRMEKMSWVDKVTNTKVLQKVQEKMEYLKHSRTVKTQTMDWTHFETRITVT